LKENVILGHLIPAGTGFRSFQESEVRYNLQVTPEAAPVGAMDEDSYPLLDAAPGNGSNSQSGDVTQPAPPSGPPSGLEEIFGTGDLGES
jgi:DNA-directed RNA polymerase subunit beta'